ncbi:hypothetical protein MNBD_GAMMA24-14 [hydrothermal vent metagenome]|uniref:DUF4124 domain-containing protein n=1 Tax=hydrothermal vent metagenome TaxID=652676 RepID=A0A3B1BDV2_9ZZZZ
MKLIFKLMLLALLLVGVSPFLLHGPNGKPILSLDKLALPNLARLFDRASSASVSKTIDNIKSTADEALPVKLNDNNTAVHKWRDERGIWHFSDKQNPQGKDEVVLINTNTNVVQADPKVNNKPNKPANGSATGGEKENKEDNGPGIPFPTTIPLQDIPKLIKDTQVLKNSMNKRYQEQQKLLDSLQSKQ